MIRALAAIFVLSIISACAPTEPAKPEPAAPTPVASIDETDACHAKALAHLIGKPITDAAVPPPASRSVRHIRPGDAVTEDLRIERLNIYVTSTDMIEKINCG
jgi:hypothetical protein